MNGQESKQANGTKRTNRRIGAKEARAAKGGRAAPKTATKRSATVTKEAPAKRARARRSARSRQVEAVARRYFDALAARDTRAMAECWNAEGVEEIGPLGLFRGPSEIEAIFREIFSAMPDAETSIPRLVADDSKAAVEWRMSGTFSGSPFMGIEATGRSVVIRGLDLLEIDVEQEKIVSNTGYYDGAEFARQIGLLPPRESGAEKAMTKAFNAVTRVRRAVEERRAQP